MFRCLRAHLTYANVVATLALFLALGGGAYAAATIGSPQVIDNSLQSQDLKDNSAVRTRDVADDTVTGGGLGGWDIKDHTLGGRDLAPRTVRQSELAPAEGWHDASLLRCDADSNAGWANHPNSGFSSAAFYRDPLGTVHLKGVVRLTTTTNCPVTLSPPIFDLPPGYRPAKEEVFAAMSNGVATRVDVFGDDGSGQVDWAPNAGEAGPQNYLSLDGISFRCEPSGSNGCP